LWKKRCIEKINGTNFQGAETVLQRNLLELDGDREFVEAVVKVEVITLMRFKKMCSNV
jgi:hypothetical protein